VLKRWLQRDQKDNRWPLSKSLSELSLQNGLDRQHSDIELEAVVDLQLGDELSKGNKVPLYLQAQGTQQ